MTLGVRYRLRNRAVMGRVLRQLPRSLPPGVCTCLYKPFPWVQMGPVAVMKSVTFLIGLHYMTGDEIVAPLIRLPFIRPGRRKL